MLYPKREQPMDLSLFQHPTSEYRGTPFWAWNCKLEEAELLWQIEQLKSMGMGGFHMHSRPGLATPYLGEEFMHMVKACVDKAEQEGMLAWLYDEDRWPSGAAGGMVTQNPAYRARYLVFSPTPPEQTAQVSQRHMFASRPTRAGSGELMARYYVKLHEDGSLLTYRRLKDEEGIGVCGDNEAYWYAYRELSAPNPWYNNQTYINTLDPAAVAEFVRITHERYKEVVGDRFGKSVPAIFTDEPQFSHKTTLGDAHAKHDVEMPWVDDFADSYRQAYGEEFFDTLPELYWEKPGGAVSLARYRFHDHVAERFAAAFAGTCGDWCRENGLMLTGHMMEEATLQSQTAALGEAMRSYRSFALPGIDMLCDAREYNTLKQAQSASRQYGCPGVLSEIYGVTNWHFDFRGHKLGGDWQAAMGVTVRVHHLSWVSMAGESKRDYPASINYQVPWKDEYPLIEDHFARINTAMTRGKPCVRVGAIHPIESFWLAFGPWEQTRAVRQELDEQFEQFVQWMAYGIMDFDYIAESLLPDQCPHAGAPLQVGQMAYDAIVVPGCRTLRGTTVDRLEAFAQAGGRLIFAGPAADLVDARPSDRVKRLALKAVCVPFAKRAILEALRPIRDVEVLGSDKVLYQMRADGENRWLFLCHGNKEENPDIFHAERMRLLVRGQWRMTLYDTITGRTQPLAVCYDADGRTWMDIDWHVHDSVLLLLEPGASHEESGRIGVAPSISQEACVARFPVRYALSEPNVLLMDMAHYAFDDGLWQPPEEILRIDNQFRKQLNYPMRTDASAQPWVIPAQKAEHRLLLRFDIDAECALRGIRLALENATQTEIQCNGIAIESRPSGWYVDHAIQTVDLPDLPAGRSVIELSIPFHMRAQVEWCYLLGDFGVRVAGCQKTLTNRPQRLGFGDIVPQGLPFYGGNITYYVDIETGGGDVAVTVPQYRGAVLGVELDGKREGTIAFAPYRFVCRDVAPGRHTLGIILFGSRVNTFGQVHNGNEKESWPGPTAWRTQGLAWSDEYRLKRCGVLISPRIECESGVTVVAP